MENKFTISCLLFSILCFSDSGKPSYGRFNMNAFNPAFVGAEGREISFTSRSIWFGIADAPKVNYFFYSGGRKKNLSLGASVISNQVYIDTRTQYSLDASYQLEMGGGTNLYLGVKAGATSKKTDIDALERITQTAQSCYCFQWKCTFPSFWIWCSTKGTKILFVCIHTKLS